MRRLLLALTVMCLGVLTSSAITLDEIIAKNIEARGGLAKIKSLKTLVMDGTMSMSQGMELNFTQTQKRPMKFRMDMSFQGMSMVTAYDGTTAWGINPMAGNKPEKQPASEAKRMADQADMDGLLVDWKDKGYLLELVGPEDIDGATAYKIKITDKDKEVKFIYIDATTWLDVKLSMRISMMGQEADVDMMMSNYQEVGGVQMPMLMEMRSEGQTILSMSYSNPKVNTDIPDSRFAFPGETPAKKN
ncbi:MAG: hypothetical protein IPH85_11650 [Ignavibacteria bacterium]|nr:hypothetical protein [Ignavibacteria bacterium]MBP6510448.1 hypothetical protein [Candidatus Kapabacteria bacterium]MBK6417678.1 hypothetical protein [Ignavibacteria bacterium]MBK6760709.1 hypothetical protein [Ignavibacteria bacterium]MBK7186552.1 hypothetical protein [Ignavibacteria bacterium]